MATQGLIYYKDEQVQFKPCSNCPKNKTKYPTPTKFQCQLCFCSFKFKASLQRHYRGRFPNYFSVHCAECGTKCGTIRADRCGNKQRQAHKKRNSESPPGPGFIKCCRFSKSTYLARKFANPIQKHLPKRKSSEINHVTIS